MLISIVPGTGSRASVVITRCAAACLLFAGCSGSSGDASPAGGTTTNGSTATGGRASGATTSATTSTTGSADTTTSTTGASTNTTGTNTAGASATSTTGTSATSASTGGTTVTCAQAASPFTVSTVALDASLVPHTASQGFGTSLTALTPVAVDPATGNVYVGFTRAGSGGALESVIVPVVGGAATPVVTAAGAALGGIAVTSNGFGVLAFDPNDDIDARTWAAVRRFDATGAQTFSTDLFRSANLTDEGTKGAPATSRLVYSPSNDQLVAYFAHTEMIQAVRHQGGYLATLDAAGTQTVVNDWWGSHNLDQRALVSGSQVALLGLGDAYPKGIFFAFEKGKPQTQVIYTLAGNGQGTTNGELGGIADLDDVLAIPFITNDSISQTLTPGDWPNIDATIADQISTAAANGNKLGMLLVPKTGTIPSGDLTPTWLEPSLTAGAHLDRLKSARYGTGDLVLLAWAEVSGTSRSMTRNYFTMIVDRSGAICQPKTPLATGSAFTAGDDFVRRGDGSIVWSNVVNNVISITTLTPN